MYVCRTAEFLASPSIDVYVVAGLHSSIQCGYYLQQL